MAFGTRRPRSAKAERAVVGAVNWPRPGAQLERGRLDADQDVVLLVLVRVDRVIPERPENTCRVHDKSRPAELAAHGGPDLSFAADGTLTAGFRVRAGHNMLDATLAGLLADRKGLEGRLLHHLEQDAGETE